MPSQQLFIELQDKTENAASVFDESGMLNKYNKLTYGFFPLGSGILDTHTDPEEKISNFRIMVLGNDFGTDAYLNNECPDNKERESNPTIRNLMHRLKLHPKNSFFTNFHLGVRKEGTNINRVVELKDAYRKLCFEFFITQLEIINPEIVLCLGHEVRRALMDSSPLFSEWKPKDVSLKKLFDSGKHQIEIHDSKLGNRKFIVIPHPCDNRNLNVHLKEILNKIQ